jgi:uncharacterized protein
MIVLEILRPKDLLSSVYEITPDFLAARGLRGLMLDIDNTLVPHRQTGDVARVCAWLETLRICGCQIRLVSNARKSRIVWHAQALNLKAVGDGMTAGKPFALAFRHACREMNLEPRQVGMVGDQIFTDVLGANWIGAHSILVRPISDDAMPHTKIARQLERRVLKRFDIDW